MSDDSKAAARPKDAPKPEAAGFPARKAKRMLIYLLVIVAILGIAGTALFYRQHRQDQKLINAAGTSSPSEVQALIKKVSHLMVLPAGEKPAVATVSDYRKLPRQAFFHDARNGDKVLIYAKAKTAILYDPKQNLILAVTPLNTKADQ